jgi:hypothetical protein
MSTRFSLAQVETAKANLDALPPADKDTREVGLQAAIKALAPTIRKLASRGYSRQKILELLREQGIEISPSTLKHYLGDKRPKRDVSPSKKGPSAPSGAGASVGEHTTDAGLDRRPNATGAPTITAPRESTASKSNGGAPKSGSTART